MFSLSLGNSSSKYFDYTTPGKSVVKMFSTIKKRGLKTAPILALVIASGACAAFRPTDPTGPRADVRLYPVGLADPAARLEEASLAWYQLSQQYGLPDRTQVNLDPYTATLQSLPPNTGQIHLPKVGDEVVPTEEQTRESLRRFIAEWRRLIGAEPQELALVERVDEPSGIKLARYEQRPFRYPLRGGYGNLNIRFRANREVVSLSSNCLPNAERLQSAIGAVNPQVSGEDAVNKLKAQPIATGQQTIALPANAVLEPRQLVVYALPPPGQSGGLELHLAWEINVTNGPIKTVYFDVISSQVIAVA